MFIKIKCNVKPINNLVPLIVLLNFIPSVNAGLLDPPVISYSITDCRRSYLVQLFDDGRIEYRGGAGVKSRGWHTGHISPQAVQTILKKINSNPIFTSDDRENLPRWNNRDIGMAAIRIRQANQYLTFFGGGKLGGGIFDEAYCWGRELVYLGADEICEHPPRTSREERDRLNQKSTFSQLELEIMRTSNLTQWVTNPGRSYCLRPYSTSINDLKKQNND